ncbi:alanine racemase [Cephaloticoccus primus]|uniref:Alanine racemase n=1 Tax=Cephaloticoccus primus TaxID=1548207 RepID=A0A139SQ04_9BACT|nr:alanine racemase [Cephaloticoccus primus]KXU36594.1 alanine racemase [Cephaloticoccus primus]
MSATAATTPHHSHRCWAQIDLAALERNLRLIRASLPAHMRYVAVVKADAYGHGLHHAAARMMHSGADLFAVANVTEAAQLRELGPGWPILVLSPLLPAEDHLLCELDLAATVSTPEEVARFEAVGQRFGRRIKVHLKIDTGMGRLGVWHAQAPALCAQIQRAPHLALAGLYTHFASPDDDPAFTAEQRRNFLDALTRCEGQVGPLRDALFIHADNSAGLGTLPEESRPFNAVRIGLLQFGILPAPHALLTQVRTEPVFSFHTRIGIVKHLPAGTTISYGRSHRLTRDTRVAVLCAGYGDGIPRALSNRGQVLIDGQRCPILGRVTMDQTIVDVSALGEVRSGDEVVLIGTQGGAQIDIGEFSRWADTIPWEILCSITKRVPRLYQSPLGI